MKTIKLCFSTLCGCLFAVAASGQIVIDNFEYANDAALLAKWAPGAGAISLSSYVSPDSGGAKSMKLARNFDGSWASEPITGPALAAPMALTTNQYVTLRIAGDTQFTNATWRMVYVYLYDNVGNFGRVASLVPTTTNWSVVNMKLSGTNAPWDSPGLPDLGSITNFSLMVIGQGETPGLAYDSTIYFDDLEIRDAPIYTLLPGGVQMVQDWEYASDADLWAQWAADSGTIALSSNVASGSKGTNSLRIDRTFASDWDTLVLTGPQLPAARAIKTTQYLTVRVAGDPGYANASYNSLFVYAYDARGNFHRVGSPVPASTNWQIFNFPVSGLANAGSLPWNSPGLPELNNIVQFKVFIYGQGAPAGPAFDSVTYLDDLQIRDSALIEFGPPSPIRTQLDNFESYADATALNSFYTAVNSGGIMTSSLETPAPQGTKALKMSIDFPSMQYPWAAVRSSKVNKFSFPTNGIVQCKFKGDPALAPYADAGTSFWIEFFDEAGRMFRNNQTTAAVTSGEWTTVKLPYNRFWISTPTDTGNLVQWRILVQGWTGDPLSLPPALTGTFYVDELLITVPPVAAVVQDTGGLKLRLSSLIPGTTYTIMQTTDFTSWTSAGTVQATSDTATWNMPPGQKGFFQVSYTP